MKKISVLVLCFNEENSIDILYNRITDMFATDSRLLGYDYELIFCDDKSRDNTRDIIEKLAKNDNKVKAVFNSTNFGFDRNLFQSFSYASGDAAFLIFGDIQDPPEELPSFIEKWEEGYKCIVGQRIRSTENPIKYAFRKFYYRFIDILSGTQGLDMVNGYGLYDRTFIDTVLQIHEVKPFFKTVLKEYGGDVCVLPYEQDKGLRGKSNFNFWRNYDFAMHGITSGTKMLMRICTFVSVFLALICMIWAVYIFVRKLVAWDSYPFGTASIMVGIFFLGSVQLFFIGILGEYILSVNEKVDNKPRTVVERTINME